MTVEDRKWGKPYGGSLIAALEWRRDIIEDITHIKNSRRYRPPRGSILRPDLRGEQKDVEGCKEGCGWKHPSDCSPGTRELPPEALALGR